MKKLIGCAALAALMLMSATAAAGPLRDKARGYDDWYQRHHSYGYGGTSETTFADPELTRPLGLDGIGDSTEWTGTYLASQAFRYAVEPSPEALANAKKAVEALHAHLIASSRKGYLTRYVGPLTELYLEGAEAGCKKIDNCHIVDCPPGRGFGEAEKCFWLGDTSRDMYLGYFNGMTLAYDLIPDPELRAAIQADFRTLIDRLLADNLKVIEPTDDGGTRITGAGHPGPNLRMQWLLCAAHVLDDPKIYRRYLAEYYLRWPQNIFYANRYLNLYFEYFAFKLDSDVYFSLMRLEDDPVRKAYYRSVYTTQVYKWARGTGNVYMDYIWLAGTGKRDAGIEGQDRRVLNAFVAAPNRLRRVEMKKLPLWESSVRLCQANIGLARAYCAGKPGEFKISNLQYFRPVSREAQPFEGRPVEDFYWQREPNRLGDFYPPEFTCGELKTIDTEKLCTDPSLGRDRVAVELRRGHRVYAGVDYLAPYWMGRYYGFIGAEE